MNGIVVVDKPPSITSAKVVARVKQYFGARKVGHAGTLDPFATGVLICLVNRATRLADFLLHGEKRYDATLCLGVETDTQDLTGKVIATADHEDQDISPVQIEQVCRTFLGEQQQVPPAFSAVKHKGRPLYEYARQGVMVLKPPRKVVISALRVEDIDYPLVRLSVTCSAGTYIRTLCADIGRQLGCGAYLKTLRRTAAAGFEISEAVTLEALTELATGDSLNDRLINMNQALRNMPAYRVDPSLAGHIRTGRPLALKETTPPPGVDDKGGIFKVVDEADTLVAIVRRESDAYSYCCVFPAEDEAT